MATVKEFKEWLNQFDDDTIIEINNNHEFTLKSKEDVYLGRMKDVDFTDFRDNKYTKEDNWWYGKQVLNIGDGNN